MGTPATAGMVRPAIPGLPPPIPRPGMPAMPGTQPAAPGLVNPAMPGMRPPMQGVGPMDGTISQDDLLDPNAPCNMMPDGLPTGPEDAFGMGQEFGYDPNQPPPPPGLPGGLSARGPMPPGPMPPGAVRPLLPRTPGLTIKEFPMGVAPYASTIARPPAPGASTSPAGAPRATIPPNGLLTRPMGMQGPTDASL
mmetsp:Transcript_10566/g.33449  ORF Transcript_10566/g.33449 Transcript_10566/m.33449 type:complete len:194 (+) Transcript_10566:2-583(+)